MPCASALAVSARIKKERQEERKNRRIARERLKTRKEWEKEAQIAFNAYIRARDAGLPCISCGCHDGQGKRNAGHYRPAGINTALRFDERNCNGQCERCNTYLSGNLSNYRAGLLVKIGAAELEELDSSHDIKRWTIDELKEIKAEYKAKLKELKQ